LTRIEVQQKVLSENERIAKSLRERVRKNGIYCSNLISSPGAGKTLLLERTLAMFPPDTGVAVLTGDIQTDNDAKRLAKYGFPVREITTGGSCHLDARMVERKLEGWDLEALDYLFIENVGNLVCRLAMTWASMIRSSFSALPREKISPSSIPELFHGRGW
jgi:hydrogenase nickel incorporation protein HypB